MESRQFICLEPVQKHNIVFDETNGRWKPRKTLVDNSSYSNEIPCTTMRDALLHLKRHIEIPKGTLFLLNDGNGGVVLCKQ